MRFRKWPAYGPRRRWRRLLDLCLAGAVIAATAFIVARVEHYAGETISGPVRVVDGDTLARGSRRFRLIGIDAPELQQRCSRGTVDYPCGLEAAEHLRVLIEGQLDCRTEGSDRYRRALVRCRSDGIDVNSAMVRSGHAIAYGDYQLAEAEARAKGVGLWAGQFVRPADWRAGREDGETWYFIDLVIEKSGALWRLLKG